MLALNFTNPPPKCLDFAAPGRASLARPRSDRHSSTETGHWIPKNILTSHFVGRFKSSQIWIICFKKYKYIQAEPWLTVNPLKPYGSIPMIPRYCRNIHRNMAAPHRELNTFRSMGIFLSDPLPVTDPSGNGSSMGQRWHVFTCPGVSCHVS